MRPLFTFLLTMLLCSCSDDEEMGKACTKYELPGIANTSNTIIPLHDQNFWVYSDSLWEDGIFLEERSSLLIIDDVYQLDAHTAIQFNAILPLLTIQDDTLFATLLTPGPETLSCYEQTYPMFFPTQDTVIVDTDPSLKMVFPSPASVQTPLGSFSNNTVFTEGDIFKVTIQDGLGIIKIGFYIPLGDNDVIKRRILTLKDYHLVE